MKIEIINNDKIKVNRPGLIQWIHKVCNELKRRNIQPQQLKKNLTVAFIDEKTIKKLNQKFRKKDHATDILSFSPVQENSLGELALCLSVIHRKKPDKFSNEEWLYYLVLHGLLHLLGFEHEKTADSARKMYHLQDTVFKCSW